MLSFYPLLTERTSPSLTWQVDHKIAIKSNFILIINLLKNQLNFVHNLYFNNI